MADRALREGEIIGGRFTLIEPLGKGAFGSVWKAADGERGGAPIALKILLERYRRDRKMLQRFVQEARILERLEHPNIAPAVAWGAEGPESFLALEYIDGETLDVRCAASSREGQFIPKQGVAWICDQLCAAVGFAHAHDVVHRDLKPKNVMVNRRGTRPFVKVLDFGIAKMLVGSEIDPTTVGRVLGSVLYISPEQVLGRAVDHRADIFSLGTILFELLTSRRAWARESNGEPHVFHRPIEGTETNSQIAVLRRIAREARPKPSKVRPELSPAVDAVLAKAMAIDAADRFDTAEDLARELRFALMEQASQTPALVPEPIPENTPSSSEMYSAMLETTASPMIPSFAGTQGNLHKNMPDTITRDVPADEELDEPSSDQDRTRESPLPTPMGMPATPAPKSARGALGIIFFALAALVAAAAYALTYG